MIGAAAMLIAVLKMIMARIVLAVLCFLNTKAPRRNGRVMPMKSSI